MWLLTPPPPVSEPPDGGMTCLLILPVQCTGTCLCDARTLLRVAEEERKPHPALLFLCHSRGPAGHACLGDILHVGCLDVAAIHFSSPQPANRAGTGGSQSPREATLYHRVPSDDCHYFFRFFFFEQIRNRCCLLIQQILCQIKN